MIEAMPRKLPPFVYREITRHGRAVYYYRRGLGPRTRLPDFGADDFEEAYRAALSGGAVPSKRLYRPTTGTLAWLIGQYKRSAAYAAFSHATRRQKDAIYVQLIARNGAVPYRAIGRQHIADARARREGTPHQARHVLNALRGLFRWAKAGGHVDDDPTEGVTNPAKGRSDGHPPWSDDDVAAYERRWGEGTKERVWLHVLLYTGLRRGDAVKIGKQHVRGSMAFVRTEKTGIEVAIPMQPELERTLAAGPTGDLAWICGERGEPLTKESFGNVFKEACVAAGLPERSAHGLRKTAATIAAERGLTVAELEALFGWQGGRMASYYTRTANRRRLAEGAAEKIRNAKTPHLVAGAGSSAESTIKSIAEN